MLKNQEDLNGSDKEKLKELHKVAPVLTEMHALKEELRNLFETSKDWGDGLLNIADWLKGVSKYFPKSFGTIKRWIGEIAERLPSRILDGSFLRVRTHQAIAYFDERTTQGVVEGINNKLKLIKSGCAASEVSSEYRRTKQKRIWL